jgi:hypothetical protein
MEYQDAVREVRLPTLSKYRDLAPPALPKVNTLLSFHNHLPIISIGVLDPFSRAFNTSVLNHLLSPPNVFSPQREKTIIIPLTLSYSLRTLSSAVTIVYGA